MEKSYMEEFQVIKNKLALFVKKYYTNELIKGALLFLSIGLLYFIIVLLLENFLWLTTTGRSILFWSFISVEIGLLIKFILIPLGKLFKLSKGLDEVEASRIIGKHFPEVNDKLLNLLQLQKSSHQSELLLAGIAQKSKELQPIPFASAVNYNKSYRYFKYAAFPIIIILAFIITGNLSVFTSSYNRVVNYNVAFEPPAPFSFFVLNNNLQALQNSDFILQINTAGSVVPERVSIHFNNETYYLKSNNPGEFTYTFNRLEKDVDFYVSANNVRSKPYTIKVVPVPQLLDFKMTLNFPSYLNKNSEVIKGTGNTTIPEGTLISWNLKTQNTQQVNFLVEDSIQIFKAENNSFLYQNRFYQNTNYKIATSGNGIENHEQIGYKIAVIKDQSPKITVSQKIDTINNKTQYYYGKVADDYGLSKLRLVYYPEENPEALQFESIPVTKAAFDEFLFTFPGNIQLEDAGNYILYFEVTDNDGIRGGKSSRSEAFSYRRNTLDQQKEIQLQQQQESIDNLSESLEQIRNNENELQEFNELQKQKEELNYNDRKKLDEFLERQKQQNNLLKNYSEKLKESFKEEQINKEENNSNQFKKDLEDRLERNEKRLEENEKLLEELKEYTDKISKEELTRKLEDISKKNKTEQKNLEQLLELTKRFYVEEKTQKLSRDLNKLAEKQEELSKENEGKLEDQENLTKEFEEFKNEMDELQKENEKLKKPLEIKREKVDENAIQMDMENAEDSLENNEEGKAKEAQKNAAEKMKEMSKKLASSQSGMQGEQLDANIESLRQILDNLLIFSFRQEDLLDEFKAIRIQDPTYAAKLRSQNVLKENFKHIDDSLYTLALSNPMLNEEITSKITNIDFDLDKSIERLADNQLPQGTASQQYVITGANDLAYFLSQILDNMQDMANPSPGKGSGSGQQIPDIIKSQQELMEEMGDGIEQQEKEGEGENGKDNEGEGEQKGNKPGDNEESSEQLFEIYKRQQELRRQLENQIKENDDGMQENLNLLRSMEEIERDLLNKGFNKQTLNKMQQIEHQLMKMEDALMEQDEDSKRTANTNLKEFDKPSINQNIKAKDYFKSTEILNRQILPLRQNYKAKVNLYFEGAED